MKSTCKLCGKPIEHVRDGIWMHSDGSRPRHNAQPEPAQPKDALDPDGSAASSVEKCGNDLYDLLEKELKPTLPPDQFERICKAIVASSMTFYDIGMKTGMKATQRLVEEHLQQQRS